MRHRPNLEQLGYGWRVNNESVWAFPDEPTLRQAAVALHAAGQWGIIYDAQWRIAWLSDAQVSNLINEGHVQTSGERQHALAWNDSQFWAMNPQYCLDFGGFVLADTPGGKDELRGIACPEVGAFIDDMIPNDDNVVATSVNGRQLDDVQVTADIIIVRLRDLTGTFVGAVYIQKPAGDAFILAAMTGIISPQMVQQMRSVIRAARRPAAILCADLDGSTSLSRRLSTANYFRLVRRWVFSTDRCIVNEGGLVGRHAGDGVTAFFLAESLGSESGAARACISAARSIRQAAERIAERSDVNPGEVVTRFGLHWGSTLYVGAISSQGRFEVTALGDQVNEAARIEACASGGRTLASKELMERLAHDDAIALGIDTESVSYSALGDLSTATEKARRDAPVFAVCDV
jgi:class 3 adenylate cyclase